MVVTQHEMYTFPKRIASADLLSLTFIVTDASQTCLERSLKLEPC